MSYLRKEVEVLSAVCQERALPLALVFVEMLFFVFLSEGCVGVGQLDTLLVNSRARPAIAALINMHRKCRLLVFRVEF